MRKVRGTSLAVHCWALDPLNFGTKSKFHLKCAQQTITLHSNSLLSRGISINIHLSLALTDYTESHFSQMTHDFVNFVTSSYQTEVASCLRKYVKQMYEVLRIFNQLEQQMNNHTKSSSPKFVLVLRQHNDKVF